MELERNKENSKKRDTMKNSNSITTYWAPVRKHWLENQLNIKEIKEKATNSEDVTI